MKKQLEVELQSMTLTDEELTQLEKCTQQAPKRTHKPIVVSVVWVGVAFVFILTLLPALQQPLHNGAKNEMDWHAFFGLFATLVVLISNVVYVFLLYRYARPLHCPACGQELTNRYARKKMWKGKTPCPHCGITTFRLRMAKKYFALQLYLIAMLQLEPFVFRMMDWPVGVSLLIIAVLYALFFYRASTICELVDEREGLW